MPIAILSVDSAKLNLDDFRGMERGFDVVYVSTCPEAQAIVKTLSEYVQFSTVYETDLLGPAQEDETNLSVYQRMQTVMLMIKQLGILNAMVVTHDSALKGWNPNVVSDTWEITEL